MVAVQVTDEYSHLPVDSCFGLEELPLCALSTVEEQQLRTSPNQHTGEHSVLAWNASASAEEYD